MADFSLELDVSDMSCSWRILRVRDALNTLNRGERLKVTSDPGMTVDLQAFIRQTGNTLVVSERIDDREVFVIEKS